MPYLRGVHEPFPLPWEETVPALLTSQRSQFCMYTSLTPKPMTVVFGLGTRLHLHMCARLENGVLHNTKCDLHNSVNSICVHRNWTLVCFVTSWGSGHDHNRTFFKVNTNTHRHCTLQAHESCEACASVCLTMKNGIPLVITAL